MKNPRITPEEVGIIKRAQAGDESAFNALFRKYKGFVENVLFQYLKDMDEAKDLANIVFLKVHEKLSLFTAYNSFGGWLRIISNRTAVDYLRETRVRRTVFGESLDRLPEGESFRAYESELVTRLTYDRILNELDKLPSTTRKVCKLFYVSNYTVEQISEKLNVPTGTIKSMLHRTRSKIRKSFNVKKQ